MISVSKLMVSILFFLIVSAGYAKPVPVTDPDIIALGKHVQTALARNDLKLFFTRFQSKEDNKEFQARIVKGHQNNITEPKKNDWSEKYLPLWLRGDEAFLQQTLLQARRNAAASFNRMTNGSSVCLVNSAFVGVMSEPIKDDPVAKYGIKRLKIFVQMKCGTQKLVVGTYIQQLGRGWVLVRGVKRE